MTEVTAEVQAPPRWVVFALVLAILLSLGGAAGVYGYVVHLNRSSDLKKATELRIHLPRGNSTFRTVHVTDPAKVRALVDALEVLDTQHNVWYGNMPANGYVEFLLPQGWRRCTFISATQLDREAWGTLSTTQRFYLKVNEVAGQELGKPVDIMKPTN